MVTGVTGTSSTVRMFTPYYFQVRLTVHSTENEYLKPYFSRLDSCGTLKRRFDAGLLVDRNSKPYVPHRPGDDKRLRGSKAPHPMTVETRIR